MMSRNTQSCSVHLNSERRFSLPWYLSLAVVIGCVVMVIMPDTLGSLIPTGTLGVILVAFIAVGVVYAFIPLWQSANMSIVAGAFVAALPILSAASFRLHIGIDRYTYGPDFVAVWLFSLVMLQRDPTHDVPKPDLRSLWAYCYFGLFSVIWARHSIFSAFDQYILMILLPTVFFLMLTKIVYQSNEAWWISLGIIGFALIAIVISFLRFSQVATKIGLDANTVLSLDSKLLDRFSVRHALIGGGLWGSGTIIGRASVIATPLALAVLLRHDVNKLMRIAAFSCVSLMVYRALLGYSRSVLGGIVLGITVFFFLVRRKVKWIFVLGLVVILFIAFPWLVAYFQQRPTFIIQDGSITWATEGRWARTFPTVWRIFLDNPLVGVGMGYENYVPVTYQYGWGIRHAHNLFLQLLSDRGVFAALFYTIFYFGACFLSLNHYREAENENARLLWAGVSASLAGITFFLQFEMPWVPNRAFMFEIQLWVLLALPYSCQITEKSNQGLSNL